MNARTFPVALAGAALFWFVGAQPGAAAITCKGDSHEVELLICKTEALQKLDTALGEVYKKALAVAEKTPDKGESAKLLKAIQRGWIGERNDCWKDQDQLACATSAYTKRIAVLQAQFNLAKASDPVFYFCEGNPANEIVVTIMDTDPPTARLEHGDETMIALQTSTEGGARYDGEFGNYFWMKGDKAEVAWPQDKSFTCAVRK
jgi:uncharacterized protein